MESSIDMSRRSALGMLAATSLASGSGSLIGGALLTVAPAALAAVPTNVVTVLYRRESAQAPGRLEPVTQAAVAALEREFINRSFRVVQPTADVYQLLDQGQGVIITFAEDAGFSLVFSVYADVRPAPGQEAGIAEVRLATRVYVGRNILVSEEGRGQMFTRLEAGNREFGMRRALELAAQRAAADVADKAARQLQALSPERINQMVGSKPTGTTTAQVVGVPPGGGAPGSPSTPPPLGPGIGGTASPPPLPSTATPGAPPPLAPPPLAPPPSVPAAPAELSAPKQRWALVVGMSDYSNVRTATGWGVGNLPGVAKDTGFVETSLAKLGFPADRTTVLRDAKATGSAVRGVLKTFAAQAGPDDVVLVFIAGHGVDKNETASGFGMPVLADHKPGDPANLDFWELQSFIKNLRGRVVWINDTCHSGGAANNLTSVVMSSSGVTAFKDLRGPDAQTVAGNAGPGQDFAILTACSPSELSLETPEGGLFTTTLFRSLLASGGRLSLASVYAQSVQTKVMDSSRAMCRAGNLCNGNDQQTPTMAYSGRGNLIRL